MSTASSPPLRNPPDPPDMAFLVVHRNDRTAAFFDAAANDVFLAQRCTVCAHWTGPAPHACVACRSELLEWAPVGGDATVVSWTVVHGRPGSTVAPAVVVVGELEEGPWLNLRLVGAPAERLGRATPLRIAFLHPDEGESIPVFHLRSERTTQA